MFLGVRGQFFKGIPCRLQPIQLYPISDLSIGEEATLRCDGDGSPEPSYEWQQLVAGSDPGMTRILRRANDTILHIRWAQVELELRSVLLLLQKCDLRERRHVEMHCEKYYQRK